MVHSKKLDLIINLVKEKKYSSLKILDISEISIIADYFVIISMPSERSIDAIDNDITELMIKNNYNIKGKEGVHSKWVLIDLEDIIIHIFDDEYKNFYNLDKLWADAKEVKIEK